MIIKFFEKDTTELSLRKRRGGGCTGRGSTK
jgi:hypothetical protein